MMFSTRHTERKADTLMGDMDYSYTPEDLARADQIGDEFARKNPNHPTVIRGRKYREEHPELFQRQNVPAKAPAPTPCK